MNWVSSNVYKFILKMNMHVLICLYVLRPFEDDSSSWKSNVNIGCLIFLVTKDVLDQSRSRSKNTSIKMEKQIAIILINAKRVWRLKLKLGCYDDLINIHWVDNTADGRFPYYLQYVHNYDINGYTIFRNHLDFLPQECKSKLWKQPLDMEGLHCLSILYL